ncbi:MAG: hypothetical protein GT589_07440 [Peptoclostridium sp.]|uniref:hypothetical protein n=1 Tax=Peptoclostridium sp. TaxID=1904860 RepID=UPI00139EBD50|nr:hypothetical protein [Peptoclostridium sp.]MZQ75964.1 hypothetical protein [Peptoclostridium sp.]
MEKKFDMYSDERCFEPASYSMDFSSLFSTGKSFEDELRNDVVNAPVNFFGCGNFELY